ncbi:SMI1/KNR4 family protein [Kribbella sp. NBC_00482]|uniref:SMI1/KNR4 family protein n=1 Tax=Kribbella sp. NBC_00482 TaxID=2975968 RepID=UPI002E17C557
MHKDRDDAAAAALTELAELIAGAAPRGWKRAELHGYALGGGGSGHRGFSFLPDGLNEHGANDIDVHPSLCALHTLLGATEHLTIDLELEARGRFRAILSERLDRTDGRGFRYLLDPESEPPTLDAPAPALGEAGDPAEAVALLNEYHQLLHAVLELPDLPPPLEDWDLDVTLPQDLSALYAVADGGGGQVQFHGFAWFGLEMLEQLSFDHWWVTRGWRRFVYNSFVTEFGPPGAIRRVGDHPAWIPFATDSFGDYLAVDMAPGPNGRPGQVILIGRHQDRGPIYVAESVTELIRSHADALRSDQIERDDDGELWINSGDAYHHQRRYDDMCQLTVSGRDAGPVRGLTAETRELLVHDAPWVDLRPVRDAPALVRFAIHNCAGLDLSPLQETTVEVLSLATDTIDLSGLHGHPTVGQIVLRSEKPIDLRPLASCPNLHTLDLTDAPAADVSALGQLPNLRYLRMLRPQWQKFLAGQPRPASLAVAELAEEPLQERKFYWSFDKAYEKTRRPTTADALEWADNLTAQATDITTIKGKFKP